MSPWMGSVVLTNANTAYSLFELLKNHAHPPSTRSDFVHLPCQFLAIQLDVSAGGAELFIGNATVSSNDCGVAIFGAQVWPIYSMDSNLISTSNIYLMSDTAGVRCNVSFITR